MNCNLQLEFADIQTLIVIIAVGYVYATQNLAALMAACIQWLALLPGGISARHSNLLLKVGSIQPIPPARRDQPTNYVIWQPSPEKEK